MRSFIVHVRNCRIIRMFPSLLAINYITTVLVCLPNWNSLHTTSVKISREYDSSCVFDYSSLAVSVKMNILLFAPGMLILLLRRNGIIKTIGLLSVCALIQVSVKWSVWLRITLCVSLKISNISELLFSWNYRALIFGSRFFKALRTEFW